MVRRAAGLFVITASFFAARKSSLCRDGKGSFRKRKKGYVDNSFVAGRSALILNQRHGDGEGAVIVLGGGVTIESYLHRVAGGAFRKARL